MSQLENLICLSADETHWSSCGFPCLQMHVQPALQHLPRSLQLLDTEACLETRRTHKHLEQVQEMSRLQRWMHKLLGTHTYMSGTKCHRISEGRWQQQWQRNKVEILTEKDLNIANATTHESSAVAKSITITNTALIISELFLV